VPRKAAKRSKNFGEQLPNKILSGKNPDIPKLGLFFPFFSRGVLLEGEWEKYLFSRFWPFGQIACPGARRMMAG